MKRKRQKNIDWEEVNEFCKINKPTRTDICERFDCVKSSIYFAIRKGLLDDSNIINEPTTNETQKNKISETMKRLHKEGKHPGWSFINADSNRRSYPEKFFFKVLQNNNILDQYTIKEKLSVGKYFLDFALIEKKLDIEIDGKQHYLTEEAIQHDKIRDQYLNDNGWVVYRIAWSSMSKKPKKEIKEFLNFLNSNNIQNRTYTVEDLQKESICKCGNKKYSKAKCCQKCAHQKLRKLNLSKDELSELLKNNSMVAIGKMFNVSDVTVRHLKLKYNL